MAKARGQLYSVLLVAYACTSSHAVRRETAGETGDDLVAEVQDAYDVDTAIPSRRDDNVNIDVGGAVPDMDASTAKLNKKPGKSPKHQWVAVINATKPYARLKLVQGPNYIFRIANPQDQAHEFVVVPGDKSQPYYLTVSPENLAGDNPHKPLIIRKKNPSSLKTEEFVIGSCIECPIGHCSATDAGAPYP